MFAFIKRHWVAYVIGAALAVVAGFGLSYVLGQKWSTPPEVRAERVQAEIENQESADQIAETSEDEAGEGAVQSDEAVSSDAAE